MDKIAITFRDFTAHLIPGLMYFAGFFYLFPEKLALIEGREFFVSVLALFGAYATGFIADTVFFPKFNKLIRKIPLFKDPVVTYFDAFKDMPETAEATTVKHLAYRAMVAHLGQKVVSGTKNTILIYSCIRYVETQNIEVGNILARINSLGNLSICMAPPLLLVSAISFWKLNVLIGAAALILVYFTLRKNLSYRDWLARTAIRHYLMIRLENGFSPKAS